MERNRVLIVEDTPYFQDIFKEIVQSLNCDVVVTGSVDEARMAITTCRFEAALVDLRLIDNEANNKDGLKVLRMLRSAGDGTSAIMLTAYGTLSEASDAQAEKLVFRVIGKAEMNLPVIKERIQEAIAAARISTLRTMPSRAINLVDAAAVTQLIGKRRDTPYAAEFNSFLSRLVHDALPVLTAKQPPVVRELKGGVDKSSRLIDVRLWSRAFGSAVLARFGSLQAAQSLTVAESALPSIEQLGSPIVTVMEADAFPNFGGALYRLNAARLDEFNTPRLEMGE